MRIENLVLAIKKRRDSMAENVFNQPPQNHESFAKLQGMWQGLGDALSIISEEMKKEVSDD